MHRFELRDGTIVVTTSGALEVISEQGSATHLRIEGELPLVIRVRGPANERLVGLGERFVTFDQTGRRWEAAVSDLLFSPAQSTYNYVPVLFSSAGYGVLLSTDARALWDLKATDADAWSVVVAADSVDLFLFAGEPSDVIQQTTAITGRPPLAEPWTFGVWKTTLSGTESVLREADRLLQENIPVTACWTYDYYHPESNTGCGVPGAYPTGDYRDLPRLTGGLHDMGYRVLGYTQPALFVGTDLYDQAVANRFVVERRDGQPATFPYFNPARPDNNLFLEPGGVYVDLTRAEAGDWFKGLLTIALDLGFDGWMQDMGEHLSDDAVLFDGSSGAAARNRYVELYHEAAYEVWSAGDETTIFARAGTSGSIPYVPAMWPGDQHTDWSSDRGLPSVLPAGPTSGLAGVVAWGPDIGGLVDGQDGGAGSLDEELWIRWCQYGALNPIMRDHLGFKYGADASIDMWSTTQTVETFRSYADLHLRLSPYFYSLAKDAVDSGLPIIRALMLEFPERDESWTINDQYLLGPALLVAPVIESGARARQVWFPPGEWKSWWTGETYEGPAWRQVPAPLDQIPLFSRGGFDIPVAPTADRRLDSVRR